MLQYELYSTEDRRLTNSGHQRNRHWLVDRPTMSCRVRTNQSLSKIRVEYFTNSIFGLEINPFPTTTASTGSTDAIYHYPQPNVSTYNTLIHKSLP